MNLRGPQIYIPTYRRVRRLCSDGTGTASEAMMNVGNDPGWTLGEWAMFIALLIMEFGEDAYLYTDAGYNNVTLELLDKEPDIVVGYGHKGKMNINPRLGGDS